MLDLPIKEEEDGITVELQKNTIGLPQPSTFLNQISHQEYYILAYETGEEDALTMSLQKSFDFAIGETGEPSIGEVKREPLDQLSCDYCTYPEEESNYHIKLNDHLRLHPTCFETIKSLVQKIVKDNSEELMISNL